MLTKELASGAAPSDVRRLAAHALRQISRLLARMARQMVRMKPARRSEPVYEFYAEAGAPEGALYIDGQLVGRIDGVTRL
jgi:hypothetical protein